MAQELAEERATAPIVKESKKEVTETTKTMSSSETSAPSSMEFPEMTAEERKEFEKLMAELTPEQRVELEQLVKELEQAYEKEQAKAGGGVAMPSSAVPSSEQTWSQWFWSFFGY
jgi:hypothetical protein